jgi:hypothetical protein
LVGVISLCSGAVLDAAIGPFAGKGTSELDLFRRLLVRAVNRFDGLIFTIDDGPSTTLTAA